MKNHYFYELSPHVVGDLNSNPAAVDQFGLTEPIHTYLQGLEVFRLYGDDLGAVYEFLSYAQQLQLTRAQVQSIPAQRLAHIFLALTDDHLAMLTPAQLGGANGMVSYLSPQEIGQLKGPQLLAVGHFLSRDQIASLSLSQLTPAFVAAMTTAQIAGLTVSQLSQQVVADMRGDQVGALSETQVLRLAEAGVMLNQVQFDELAPSIVAYNLTEFEQAYGDVLLDNYFVNLDASSWSTLEQRDDLRSDAPHMLEFLTHTQQHNASFVDVIRTFDVPAWLDPVHTNDAPPVALLAPDLVNNISPTVLTEVVEIGTQWEDVAHQLTPDQLRAMPQNLFMTISATFNNDNLQFRDPASQATVQQLFSQYGPPP
ncbi:hypothetical protein [Polaromonas sp. JS666]|uniref:hypothetical protein n=1 Tax=Polaromonas sp. (strain JS666 / ATCC BAA-500) TaxID=296591 RepID=UPI0000464710|nr:hypothetical protein Bpro_5540 [Polaromonas sp. JS666]